jgi:hypothetical protein
MRVDLEITGTWTALFFAMAPLGFCPCIDDQGSIVFLDLEARERGKGCSFG